MRQTLVNLTFKNWNIYLSFSGKGKKVRVLREEFNNKILALIVPKGDKISGVICGTGLWWPWSFASWLRWDTKGQGGRRFVYLFEPADNTEGKSFKHLVAHRWAFSCKSSNVYSKCAYLCIPCCRIRILAFSQALLHVFSYDWQVFFSHGFQETLLHKVDSHYDHSDVYPKIASRMIWSYT